MLCNAPKAAPAQSEKSVGGHTAPQQTHNSSTTTADSEVFAELCSITILLLQKHYSQHFLAADGAFFSIFTTSPEFAASFQPQLPAVALDLLHRAGEDISGLDKSKVSLSALCQIVAHIFAQHQAANLVGTEPIVIKHIASHGFDDLKGFLDIAKAIISRDQAEAAVEEATDTAEANAEAVSEFNDKTEAETETEVETDSVTANDSKAEVEVVDDTNSSAADSNTDSVAEVEAPSAVVADDDDDESEGEGEDNDVDTHAASTHNATNADPAQDADAGSGSTHIDSIEVSLHETKVAANPEPEQETEPEPDLPPAMPFVEHRGTLSIFDDDSDDNESASLFGIDTSGLKGESNKGYYDKAASVEMGQQLAKTTLDAYGQYLTDLEKNFFLWAAESEVTQDDVQQVRTTIMPRIAAAETGFTVKMHQVDSTPIIRAIMTRVGAIPASAENDEYTDTLSQQERYIAPFDRDSSIGAAMWILKYLSESTHADEQRCLNLVARNGSRVYRFVDFLKQNIESRYHGKERNTDIPSADECIESIYLAHEEDLQNLLTQEHATLSSFDNVAPPTNTAFSTEDDCDHDYSEDNSDTAQAEPELQQPDVETAHEDSAVDAVTAVTEVTVEYKVADSEDTNEVAVEDTNAAQVTAPAPETPAADTAQIHSDATDAKVSTGTESTVDTASPISAPASEQEATTVAPVSVPAAQVESITPAPALSQEQSAPVAVQLQQVHPLQMLQMPQLPQLDLSSCGAEEKALWLAVYQDLGTALPAEIMPMQRQKLLLTKGKAELYLARFLDILSESERQLLKLVQERGLLDTDSISNLRLVLAQRHGIINKHSHSYEDIEVDDGTLWSKLKQALKIKEPNTPKVKNRQAVTRNLAATMLQDYAEHLSSNEASLLREVQQRGISDKQLIFKIRNLLNERADLVPYVPNYKSSVQTASTKTVASVSTDSTTVSAPQAVFEQPPVKDQAPTQALAPASASQAETKAEATAVAATVNPKPATEPESEPEPKAQTDAQTDAHTEAQLEPMDHQAILVALYNQPDRNDWLKLIHALDEHIQNPEAVLSPTITRKTKETAAKLISTYQTVLRPHELCILQQACKHGLHTLIPLNEISTGLTKRLNPQNQSHAYAQVLHLNKQQDQAPEPPKETPASIRAQYNMQLVEFMFEHYKPVMQTTELNHFNHMAMTQACDGRILRTMIDTIKARAATKGLIVHAVEPPLPVADMVAAAKAAPKTAKAPDLASVLSNATADIADPATVYAAMTIEWLWELLQQELQQNSNSNREINMLLGQQSRDIASTIIRNTEVFLDDSETELLTQVKQHGCSNLQLLLSIGNKLCQEIEALGTNCHDFRQALKKAADQAQLAQKLSTMQS